MNDIIPALIYIVFGLAVASLFVAAAPHRQRKETAICVFATWPIYVLIILVYQIVKMIKILREELSD